MSPTRRTRPRLAGVVLAFLLGALGVIAPASVAHAEDVYQYWGLSALTNGKWVTSMTGADQTTPTDGTVEGWRFAINVGMTTRAPRTLMSFEKICATTPAAAGKKRVAVVLDFGRDADAAAGETVPAPKASCAVVDTKATAAAVLAAVTTVRAQSGMICGLDGYPSTGCADKVGVVPAAAKAADVPLTADPVVVAAGATAVPLPATVNPSGSAPAGSGSAAASASNSAMPSPTTSDASSGTSPLTWAGILVVVLAIAGAAWVSVRRRQRA